MRLLSLLLLSLALAACSRQRLERLVTKTPPLPAATAARYDAMLPPAPTDHQRDAAYLAGLLRAYYPDRAGDQLDGPGAEGFDERSEVLIRAAGVATSDFEYRVLLQRYLAHLRDGHTYIPAIPYYQKDLGVYNLGLFPDRLSEALHVLAVDSAFAGRPVGGELLTVNGYGPAAIRAAALAYHNGENPYYKLSFLGRLEHLPRYWRALGLATGDSLVLAIRDTAGVTHVDTLRPRSAWQPVVVPRDTARYPFAARQPAGFFTQYLPEASAGYLQMNTSLDYAVMRREIGNYVAWPFRPLAKAVLRRERKKSGTMDFGRTVAEFFRQVHARRLDRVIVDLRYNPGGDERLGRQLMYYLATPDSLRGSEVYYRFDDFLATVVRGDFKQYGKAYAKTHGSTPAPDEWIAIEGEVLRRGFWQGIDAERGGLYLDETVPKFDGEVVVLIGPRTFSAASILAADLQANGLATLIGEPTGNRPSGPTGAARVKLPHTGTLVAVSYIYFERADPGLMHLDATYPDVYAPRTVGSIASGVDPAVEAALAPTLTE